MLRSDLDGLEDVAAQTAGDLRGALYEKALTEMSNLRDKVSSLEAALERANRFAAPIKEIVKSEMVDSAQLNDLEGRIEALEDLESRIDALDDTDGRDDETRDTVRDMIRDGDITITIDLA